MSNPNCQEILESIKKLTNSIDDTRKKIVEEKNKLSKLMNFIGSQRDPTPAERAELDALQKKLETLIKVSAEKAAELAAVQKAFDDKKLTCVPIAPCAATNNTTSKILLNLNIPKQTQDTTDLIKKRTDKQNVLNQRQAEYNELHACGNNDPNLIPMDYSNIRNSEAGAIIQKVQNNKCLKALGDGVLINNFIINLNPTNRALWNNANANSKLKGSIIKQLNNLVNQTVNDLTNKKNGLEKHIEILQKEINDLTNLINELNDPDSDTNKAYRQLIQDQAQKILNQCITDNKVEYTTNVTVSATAGPGAPGGPGISKSGDNGCIIFNPETLIFTLDSVKASAVLGPGGCDVENAFWVHPINITAVINVSNLDKIKNCFSKNIEKLTPKPKPENMPTVINEQTTINLNDCISAPKK